MAKATTGAKSGAGKSGPAAFVRQVRQEVSKVTWPSRKGNHRRQYHGLCHGVSCSDFFFFVDQGLAIAVRFILGLGG